MTLADHCFIQRLLQLSVATALFGCSSSTESATASTETRTIEEVPLQPASPAYVVQSTVFTDDGSTSYVGTVGTLDGSEAFDASKALEFGGSARTFGPVGEGWFAVGDNEAFTVTRYELDEEAGFRKGPTLGLQQRGITNLSADVEFISDTKAYYVDWENSALMIWNPVSMELEGEIDLAPRIARDGWTAQFGSDVIYRDGQLLYPIIWRNDDKDPGVYTPDTGLITIDTATNEIVDYQLEERCSAGNAVPMPNGDTYLVSSATVAVGWAMGGIATPPCALRVLAGAGAIDQDYYVNLVDLTGGLAGDGIPAGESALYLRELDETVSDPATTTSVWDSSFAAAWRLYRWDIATGGLELIDSLGYAAAGTGGRVIDGNTYLTQSTDDYSHTTLVNMSDPTGPKLGLTAQGYTYTVLRVR